MFLHRYLFLCVLLLSARPYVLAMAPVFLTEATHAAHYIYTVCRLSRIA